jgi:hypothetical protein
MDHWIRPFSTYEKGKALCNAAEKMFRDLSLHCGIKTMNIPPASLCLNYEATAIRKKESKQPNLKFMNKSHQPSAPTSPEILRGPETSRYFDINHYT